MDRLDTCCLHCTRVFDINNLKGERRRSVGKKHSDVDLIKTLAFCYNLDEVKLRNAVGYDDTSFYVCGQCFNNLKSVYTSLSKCDQLKEKLISSASDKFKSLYASNNFTDRSVLRTPQCNSESHPQTPLPTLRDIVETPLPLVLLTSRKRQRNGTTPSKSGCTPKSKKRAATPKKKNRRRLYFSDSSNQNDRQVAESPGPKVKVHLHFKGSSRKTDLKGPAKLACRSIVQKQFKTALNHLLTIDEAKVELANAVKKNVSREVQRVCNDKTSVFRGGNTTKFTWKAANKELEQNCPLTLEILKLIAGQNKKESQAPRVISSMAVLLFNRNQQMNTVQTINSVLMYRGHVRTRVYSTLNRAGFSTSYKSTLRAVDRLSEDFDLPVKQWGKAMAEQNTDATQPASAISDDHNYALPENITPIYIAEPVTESTEVMEAAYICPSIQVPIHVHNEPHSASIAAGYNYMSSPLPCIPSSAESPINTGTLTMAETVTQGVTPLSTRSTMIDDVQTPMNNDLNLESCAPDYDSPFATRNDEIQSSDEDVSFQIVMDNLNCQQKVRHKTTDNQNKTFNLVHSIAIQHRVTDKTKDSIHPQADILSIPNDAFIPNHQDYESLNSDFATLIQRTLVENIPALQDCREAIDFHIPHSFSEMSSKKSNIIPLGILEKDENITEQMIEVVEHLQQYVPRTTNGKMVPILLGGDALSVERGEAAKRARLDAFNAEDRLDGLIWKSEDWHAHVISLQEAFSLLYKGTSSGEKGTLFQLRNLFDRRGVKSEVKGAVNDCREFLRFVTQGYILLAALHLQQVQTIEELEDRLKLLNKEEKKNLIDSLSKDIVQHFIVSKEFQFTEEGATNQSKSRIPCGYPGCPKTFAMDGKCRLKHRASCQYKDFVILQEEKNVHQHDQQPNESSRTKCDKPKDSEDYKMNYVCNVLREGLMDWAREDASKENDGERLIRLWRFDMLRFSMTNHTKYTLLAFKLQAQLMAMLPPKLAYELKHNRCVNIHGGKGGNVPGDLALEFMNMRAKDALDSLHGNMTSASITRVGRSLQGCNHVLDSYTKGLEQYFGKPSNSKPSLKSDFKLFIDKLKNEDLFTKQPGRQFKSFGEMNLDVLHKLNSNKLQTWLTGKKEQFSRVQRARSYMA